MLRAEGRDRALRLGAHDPIDRPGVEAMVQKKELRRASLEVRQPTGRKTFLR